MANQTYVRSFILFLGFLLFYLVLRSHTFLGELVHDDGLFLAGAQAWANGYTPYTDFWDHKPPCVFMYNAVPLFFFPFSILAVKTFHCIVLAASAVLLFSFCKRYVSETASFISILFYIYFTSTRFTIQSGGLTEEGALVFVILSYWMLTEGKSKSWWLPLLAGISMGTAIQFRQTFVVESVFALGLLWLHKDRKQNSWKSFAIFAAGMLIPEILFSLHFLLKGAWWDYVQASYLYNFYYIGPGRPETSWQTIFHRQQEIINNTGVFLLSPIMAGLICFWMEPKHKWLCLFLAMTFIGDLLAISLSGEFYAHYYVQASVTCAVFFALVLHTTIPAWKQNHWSHQPFVTLLSILFTAAILYLSFQSGTRCYLHFQQIIAERNQLNSQYTFQHDVALAVNSITNPEDTILLIGRIPNSVYVLSGRLPGSRFYHYSPLWKPSLEGAVTERQKQAFLDDLQFEQPALLLLDLTRLRSEDGDGLYRVERDVPSALPYIQQNYTRLDELNPDVVALWDWYDIRLQIMVRNDQAEEIVERIKTRNQQVF